MLSWSHLGQIRFQLYSCSPQNHSACHPGPALLPTTHAHTHTHTHTQRADTHRANNTQRPHAHTKDTYAQDRQIRVTISKCIIRDKGEGREERKQKKRERTREKN